MSRAPLPFLVLHCTLVLVVLLRAMWPQREVAAQDRSERRSAADGGEGSPAAAAPAGPLSEGAPPGDSGSCGARRLPRAPSNCTGMIAASSASLSWEGTGTAGDAGLWPGAEDCVWLAGAPRQQESRCGPFSYWRSPLAGGGVLELAAHPHTAARCRGAAQCQALVRWCPLQKESEWHPVTADTPLGRPFPVIVDTVEMPHMGRTRLSATMMALKKRAGKNRKPLRHPVTTVRVLVGKSGAGPGAAEALALAGSQIYKGNIVARPSAGVWLNESGCRTVTARPAVFLRPQYARRIQGINLGHWLWDSLWYLFAATAVARRRAAERGVRHVTVPVPGDTGVWSGMPAKQPLLRPLLDAVLGDTVSFREGFPHHCFAEAYFEPIPSMHRSTFTLGGNSPAAPFQGFLSQALGLSFEPLRACSGPPTVTMLLRRPGGTRAIDNWRELRAAAEAAGWGVELPLLGNQTEWPNTVGAFPAVLRAVQRSDVLLAAHGSELSMMQFLRNGSAVVELTTHAYRWHYTVQPWPRHTLTAAQHHVRWLAPAPAVHFAECLPTNRSLPPPHGDPAQTKAVPCSATGRSLRMGADASVDGTRCCTFDDQKEPACCGLGANRHGIGPRSVHAFAPPVAEWRELLDFLRGLLGR